MKKSAATRQLLLNKAFGLIYVNGYQATSIDDIIAETDVTKGAFYYHFKTKEEMGLAMISEVMEENMRSGLMDPLLETEDVLVSLYEMMKELLLLNPFLQVKYGCPTYNLIQEMAPLNEQFNAELGKIMLLLRKTIIASLEKAIEKGTVRNTIDPPSIADFLMAGYGGVRVIGKLNDNHDLYHSYLQQLNYYLGTLRQNSSL